MGVETGVRGRATENICVVISEICALATYAVCCCVRIDAVYACLHDALLYAMYMLSQKCLLCVLGVGYRGVFHVSSG